MITEEKLMKLQKIEKDANDYYTKPGRLNRTMSFFVSINDIFWLIGELKEVWGVEKEE
jgi:hypothetical protein